MVNTINSSSTNFHLSEFLHFYLKGVAGVVVAHELIVSCCAKIWCIHKSINRTSISGYEWWLLYAVAEEAINNHHRRWPLGISAGLVLLAGASRRCFVFICRFSNICHRPCVAAHVFNYFRSKSIECTTIKLAKMSNRSKLHSFFL